MAHHPAGRAARAAAERHATPAAPTSGPARAPTYESYRAAFAGRAMPFAFVDLELLDENARQVSARARDKRVRIASKSVRSVAMLRRLLASDERFQGLMCFTAREAVYLAGQGFDDLLMGYPVVGARDLAAIARATVEGARITLMVDCPEHVERAERAAQQHGVQLPLCLEMDMSLDVPGLHFGVWRSPVRDLGQARTLVVRIAGSRLVTLAGVMGYEAQIAGVADRVPGQRLRSMVVRQLKRRSRAQVAARRAALVEMIRSLGISPRFVNGGGTGSVHSTRTEPDVTEITVGSAFYSPALFDHYRDFHYLPAAGFAVEIVRQPRPGLYTCLGGGYVASGTAGPEKLPRPYLPAGARLLPLEGAGEVQTPIAYRGSERLALGDPIFLRHAKAGELCERFTHLLLVSGGEVVDEVTTYRGDGQCFL